MFRVKFVDRDFNLLSQDADENLKFAVLIGEDVRSFKTHGGATIPANCYVSVVPLLRGVSRKEAFKYVNDFRKRNVNCLHVSLLTKEKISFLRSFNEALADFPQEDCLLLSSITNSRGDVDAWWLWDGKLQHFRVAGNDNKANLYLFFCLPKDDVQKLSF